MRQILFILLCAFAFAIQAQETVTYRYWFDQADDAAVTGTTTLGSVHIDADISKLAAGYHTINYQVVSPTYDESVVHSAFFCKLSKLTNQTVQVQIDGVDVDDTRIAREGTLHLNIDVDSLSLGLHSLAIHVMDENGMSSQPVQAFFVKVPSDENRKNMNMYYVIDDDSTGTRYPCVYTDSVAFANIDMTTLELGNHTIKFLIMDDKGFMTETKEATFRKIAVTETAMVEDIALSADSLTLKVGQDERLEATIMPTNASNKGLLWSSSNDSVATVDSIGVVYAKAQGSAIITATSVANKDISASCVVIVTKDLSGRIDSLLALVEEAQDIYDNSAAAVDSGRYSASARDSLLLAIDYVKAQISDNMTEKEIDHCTSTLQDAIDALVAGKVPTDNPENPSEKPSENPSENPSRLANVIYVNPTTLHPDTEAQLAVRIKNNANVQGFQFDVYLPEGIYFTSNDNGKKAELGTERTDSETFDLFKSTVQSDGALRVLGASTSGEVLDKGDGDVVLVNIYVDENIEEGEYPLIIKNAELTADDNSTYFNAYFETTLTIENYVLGDINGDGRISVTDVVMLANYVLGIKADDFNIKAADYNGDGRISVSDVVAIANAILNGQ